MTLADRAAELFLVGFPGTEPDPVIASLISEGGLAGVILFGRNMTGPEQVRTLTGRLQSLSPDLPLLIATDQEGGVVTRVSTPWPGAMTLGASGDTDLAQQVALAAGLELRAQGINLNLAPVVDVNSNPANPVIGVRSFGENPESVARFGAATIAGLHGAGVLAASKHFPGLGDTATNSFSSLAEVRHDRGRLDSVELVPFRAAIAAGVDAVMATHVALPAVEPDGLPASISHRILTGLLRRDLGFQGLILTDCLEVRSITEWVGTSEAAVRALEAGADLLLVSHTPRVQLAAIDAVQEAIASGRIPAERVVEALERVRAARLRLAGGPAAPDLSVVGCKEHLDLTQRAARQAVTAVGDLEQLCPVKAGQTVLIAVDPDPLVGVEEREPVGSPVMTAMGELAPTMRRMGIRRQPTAAELLRAIEYTAGSDLVLVATYCAQLFPAQADLVRLLRRSGRRVVVIAQRGPYDLLVTPGITGAVVMYEDRLLTARAAVRFLLGLSPAPGVMPATLSIMPSHS
ncbi:MAG: glycoside hydrolase family 3 protein [Bacillota bacterium]